MILNIILDIKDEETDVALYELAKTYKISHAGTIDTEWFEPFGAENIHTVRMESWYLLKLKD